MATSVGTLIWEGFGQGRKLLFETGTDHVDDPFFIGKLARFELGIDQIAIQGYFKTPASGWDQLEVLNFLLVGGEKLARQTDGLRLIISHAAILEFQVHVFSFPRFVVRRWL
jgi:hypothetical protein